MIDLNALPLPKLFDELARDGLVEQLLALAVREDLGDAGDVTSCALCDADARGSGHIVARSAGIVAGIAAIDMVISAFDADIRADRHIADGEVIAPDDTVATLTGSMRDLLGVERTLLNLIGRLSGIATLTHRYVDAVAGTGARIVDTRKTTPGLRRLEKYAVRCGGGFCHRLGLYDAAIIKDNHLARFAIADLPDALRATIERCRAGSPIRFVQVEVDSLDQFDAVLSLSEAGPDMVLLDNMPPTTLTDAVARRDAARPALLLEASGGITLGTIRTVAETGIDRISVGALTHSATQLDFGLDCE
ncbi:MAG: carboxylating nicotinate-nucleotide diphosphorylase [Phycisphaerales bacterium]|nr:carboxylating nicotinate-nucleotide diphosphorylase [Phycisphaerales bacterium]